MGRRGLYGAERRGALLAAGQDQRDRGGDERDQPPDHRSLPPERERRRGEGEAVRTIGCHSTPSTSSISQTTTCTVAIRAALSPRWASTVERSWRSVGWTAWWRRS